MNNVIIENIDLIKRLGQNLLSISHFIDKVFKVEFNEDKCLIFQMKTFKLALSGLKNESLFIAHMAYINKGEIYCFNPKAMKTVDCAIESFLIKTSIHLSLYSKES